MKSVWNFHRNIFENPLFKQECLDDGLGWVYIKNEM